MSEQRGKEGEPATREPVGLMEKLRAGWQRESIAHTWQHPLLTAIAVVVCLMLASLLHMKESYWAAISTVVVMQSEVGPTVSASRDRFIGTGVGALMGWLTASMWEGNVLVFGLAVAISLMLCGLLGLKNAGRLVGATICLVALVPAAGPKWRIALDRSMAVSFGVVIAVMVALLLDRALRIRRWGLG
jgi:uncharacterized membrane protein YccC